MWDENLTRWSVRLAVALYAIGLSLRVPASFDARRLGCARLAWSLGFLALLVHMAAAFHFYHHWSHAVAYVETARQTAERTGIDWGGGVYMNYAFALVWGLDAAWWWKRGLAAYEHRARWIEWLIQGYLAFIIFNATVVFGTGRVRWLGAAAIAAIAAWGWARRNRPANEKP